MLIYLLIFLSCAMFLFTLIYKIAFQKRGIEKHSINLFQKSILLIFSVLIFLGTRGYFGAVIFDYKGLHLLYLVVAFTILTLIQLLTLPKKASSRRKLRIILFLLTVVVHFELVYSLYVYYLPTV